MYKGYIYRHWIINDKGIEKSYIGLTMAKTVGHRWKDGKGYDYKKYENNNFANAIKKYGWENFHHEIIGIVESETKEQLELDLDEWEMYYIWKYDSFYNGYNSTEGGRKGKLHKNTCEKMSKAHMGKKFTENHKENISKALKNHEKTDEHKRHIGESSKGRIVSEDTRKKISDSHKREKHFMYGKTHNEETIRKMSMVKQGTNNPRATAVICLNTKEIFLMVKDASKWANIKGGSLIAECCTGKRKSAGKHPETGEKLKWMYLKDYEKLNS